jgi:hypothetical protein
MKNLHMLVDALVQPHTGSLVVPSSISIHEIMTCQYYAKSNRFPIEPKKVMA